MEVCAERWVGVARAPEGPLPPTLSPEVRIMSYNILADQYAGSTYAQEVSLGGSVGLVWVGVLSALLGGLPASS